MIDKIEIERFKRITQASFPLKKINVLVGGNNSGKSCALQGMHFGISLAQSRKIAGADQFSPDKLRYCPTEDFLDLRHGGRLTETTTIEFRYSSLSSVGTDETVKVKLTRGRNGVVKAQTNGGQSLQASISDPTQFFSIYVPGLAGVTTREEYRSELVVNNGIARGDANLYLRNVLLRIHKDKAKGERFHSLLHSIFPGVRVSTAFLESSDLWIRSVIESPPAGDQRAIDMVGTGLLQAIQLIAYVSNYSPALLLLDEPDAHLHPSNQRLLVNTLSRIASETDTKIIIATHSRHILDALADNLDASLFWMQNGKLAESPQWGDVAILMDLGALDKGEKFLSGSYSHLVWTEDSDTRYLSKVLEASGADLSQTYIFSYKSSSKIDAAIMLATFTQKISPGVKLIIHRDRDFMTPSEIVRLKSALFPHGGESNIEFFITKGSDIESYFVSPEHISAVTKLDPIEAKQLVDGIISNNAIDLALKFREKREEVKRFLYKRDPENCPPTDHFVTGSTITEECCLGKSMEKLIKYGLQAKKINGDVLLAISDALADDGLKAIFAPPHPF